MMPFDSKFLVKSEKENQNFIQKLRKLSVDAKKSMRNSLKKIFLFIGLHLSVNEELLMELRYEK